MTHLPRLPHTASTARTGRLDRYGVLLSGLCLVHCLAGLFLVGMLGIGGGMLLNPAIHRMGLVLAVIIGAATLGTGAWRHGHRLPLLLGGTGLALMAGAVVSNHGSAEAVMTIGGVGLLACAHLINMRRAH